MTKFIKLTLVIISVLIIYSSLFSLWGFYQVTHPSVTRSKITPDQFGLKYENVSFLTKDNILIKGWYVPNSNPHAKAIILLHGYPYDKGDILPSRLFLHDNFHLLFIDFRYFGDSKGNYTTVGRNEVFDLLAAVNFLNKRGIHEIGVWGFSMGAAVAIMAGAQTPQIKAIVAEASYADLHMMLYEYYPVPFLRYFLAAFTRFWGVLFFHIDTKEVSPITDINKIKTPILLIHSRKDKSVPFQHAELFYNLLKEHPNVEFLFLKDTQHGTLLPDNQNQIKLFFEKKL